MGHRKTEVQLRDPAPSAAARMFCDFVVCWQKKSVGSFGAGNTCAKRSSWWRLGATWNLTHSYPWTDLKPICSWKVLKVLFWSVKRIFDSDFHGFLRHGRGGSRVQLLATGCDVGCWWFSGPSIFAPPKKIKHLSTLGGKHHLYHLVNT